MKKLICTFIFILCFSFTVQAREMPSQSNVSPNKVWTVKFTTPYDKNTLDQVKVVDNYGNDIEVEKKIVDDKTITVEPVDGAWGRNVSYQLQTNNVKSATGKAIKSPVTMDFTTGGVNYNFTGDYKADAYNLCKQSGVSWHDGSKAYQLKAYDILIWKEDNIIKVSYDVDMWSTQNIMKSYTSNSAMKMLVDYGYSYMQQKYPNQQIRVGIFLHEFLNKKPSANFTENELRFNDTVGKYELTFLLGTKYEDGTEYYLNGGN